MAIEVGRGVSGLDEMTVGAPRSAKEALQSGAISLDALRAAHRMRDGRSAVDVVVTSRHSSRCRSCSGGSTAGGCS